MKTKRTALAGLLALLSVPALATIMVEVPLEEMVVEGEGVVRATVIHSGTQLNLRDGGSEITTITTLRVDEWLVGQGDDEIRLREIGGETARGGMRIAGTPRYRLGEEVVVFLDDDVDGVDRYFRTFALVQGKFTVLRGVPGMPAVVMRDADAVGFATWIDGEMIIDHGGEMVVGLTEFEQRVRQAGGLRPGSGVTR
ncbi:MAG: hypothetical protein AB8H86_14205 [Polyangiales bacterium]